MRPSCAVVAAILSLAAGRVAAEPSAPHRRLEAIQIGVAHHEHVEIVELDNAAIANSPTLSLEAGRFLTPELGLAALVRGQRYFERGPFDFARRRGQVLVGGRVYFQPIEAPLLVALGAGVLVERRSEFQVDYNVEPFVEAYAGWAVLRSRCTDLEVGVNAGYSPHEEYVWLGLAIGVRRRVW
jgi:hypothetical protein